MGRFESTAKTYAARREPYPPAFFDAAVKALALTGREALIDLGTGPGLLALGFASHVASIVGVDPEPAMIEEARKAAAAIGKPFPVRLGRAEDVGPELGRFDLVTIGRALHWMEREPTLAALERMLAPGGRILVCGARNSDQNPWRETFEAVLKSWGARSGQHRRVHEHFFDGSRFERVGEIEVENRQLIDREALIERALTRSSTSPATLGDRTPAFRAELQAALAPYFADGEVEELTLARGRIFALSTGS